LKLEYLRLLSLSIIESEFINCIIVIKIFGYYLELEYLRLLGLSIIDCKI
jgi:hypothetical protein